MNIFCLLRATLLTRNSEHKSFLGATFRVKPKPLDFSWLKFTWVSFSHVGICLLFHINLWNYAQTPSNYRIFLRSKKDYSCIYICPSPGGAGCSHKVDIAGSIYLGHDEPLWAPVHRHAQKTQTGVTVSLGSHMKEENLKRIRNGHGSIFLLHPPSPVRGHCRNWVSFCDLGTSKGSSKRFPCHSVQDSNIYISCTLEKHVPQFEICRSDHGYLSWDFLTAVRVAVPACLLGSQWLVSQGICYRAFMGILDIRSCDECASHGLEVQTASLKSTLECVKS